jgi:pimeloyl-ACP methyl ester carboxylesterase
LQRHDRIDGRAYVTEIELDRYASLGGLIGMVLAALPGSPIRRLVINDIGPYLPWAGLLRLGANLSDVPKSFETIEQAEDYYRRVLAPFGQLEEAHWRHLTTR